MKNRHLSLFGAVLLVLFGQFSARAQAAASQFDSKIVRDWNALFLDLERYAPGFRPCPAATAAGYLGFSLYESVVPGMPGFQSQAGHYSGLNLPAAPAAAAQINWPSAANESYFLLMSKFFGYLQATQPANFAKIQALRQQWKTQLAPTAAAAAISAGESRGQAVAQAVKIWLETDPTANNAWLSAQPASYSPPVGTGLWQPTVPDLGKAVFPYYGSARCFALPEAEKTALPPPVYSEAVGSVWRTEGEEVFNDVNTIRANGPGAYDLEWRAEFWSDDLLNLTFSPPSRLLANANQLAKNEQLNLAEAAELYAKLGLAMHDIAVATWKSKYIFNIERPVSYIRRVLPGGSAWLSALDHPLTGAVGVTPAFPAYPSGHSGFGGVTDGIFTAFFGNNFTFNDSIHLGRTEFNGTPRTFDSFAEMGEENAYSRIPLGVHFRFDCDEGLRLGRLAARRVLEMPWRSPDCSLVEFVPGTGQIEVRGLCSPVVLVQVFNASWVKIFDFTGAPGLSSIRQITGLAAGNYYVKVNLLNSGWQQLCEKTGYVNLTGGGQTGVLTFAQPTDISATAPAGQTGTSVSFSMPPASSTCPTGAVLVTQISGPASNSTFPIGQTQVCFRASDGCGNSQTRCFSVNVQPTQPPGSCAGITFTPAAGQITVGGLTAPNVLLQAFNSGWQQVFNHSGPTAPTRLISSLAPGIYYLKVDFLNGNWQPICQRDLYITVPGGGGSPCSPDVTAPVWNGCPPNISKTAAAGATSATCSWTPPTAADACSALGGITITSTHSPGATFPLGTTTVIYTAKDAANNSATCTFQVTVSPAGGSGADLEITMTADKTTAAPWSNVTYIIKVKNVGTAPVASAEIQVAGCAGGQISMFGQPFGLVYAALPAPPTAGAFNFVTQKWAVANLAAGQQATLQLTLFSLSAAEKKVVAFASAQSPADPNSQPSLTLPNCAAVQNDEALWTINAGQSALAGDNRAGENPQSVIRNPQFLFPNPAGETVVLNLAEFLEKEDVQVSILDNKGLIVRELRFPKIDFPFEEISLDGLQNGLYFVRFISPNRRAETVKLVVQRTF